MKKSFLFITIITTLLSLGLGWFLGTKFGWPFKNDGSFMSPLVDKIREKKLPLLKYTVANLQKYPYQASRITIDKVLLEDKDYTSYQFSYRTMDKTMTGQLNVPTSSAPGAGYPVIIMMRGYAPAETYTTGVGTRPAAAVFAKQGYVTLAPDFFGFGGSDPDVEDTWESRFIKPINVIELLKTVETQKNITIDTQPITLDTNKIGFWAHSNGGQITLTTLTILSRPIPTTLWAPVSAPFPYSLLFFTDEDQDEGKSFRKVLSQFEEDYNVFEFSFTDHLDSLTGPLQIHQGLADEAIPPTWSSEFVDKLKTENARRTIITDQIKNATPGASPAPMQPLPPIDVTLLTYPGTDHNMRPAWDTVIKRDLDFFAKHLK